MPAQQIAPGLVLESEQARAELVSWTLKGRISSPDERASLRWRQDGATFNLLLRGPFGFGGLRIEGDSQAVNIHDGRTQELSDEPELELWRRTGWHVPLAALPFWVRGVPAPEWTAQIGRDADGHLISIKQAGWRIYPTEYQLVDGVLMPYLLRLENDQWHLTVEVGQWTLN